MLHFDRAEDITAGRWAVERGERHSKNVLAHLYHFLNKALKRQCRCTTAYMLKQPRWDLHGKLLGFINKYIWRTIRDR